MTINKKVLVIFIFVIHLLLYVKQFCSAYNTKEYWSGLQSKAINSFVHDVS